MAGMQVGEAVGTRRLEPRRIGLRARLPLRAGKPAAKGQRTCDIAPPLSKTCVFDLTRGRVVREDQIAKSFDRPRSAGTWRPPTGRSFVFLGLGVPLASAIRDSANSLSIRPRNRAVGQSDLRRKAQGFSADPHRRVQLGCLDRTGLACRAN